MNSYLCPLRLKSLFSVFTKPSILIQILNRIHYHPGPYRNQQDIACHAHETVMLRRRPKLYNDLRRQIIKDDVPGQLSSYLPFSGMTAGHAAVVSPDQARRAVAGVVLLNIIVVDHRSVLVTEIGAPPPAVPIPVPAVMVPVIMLPVIIVMPFTLFVFVAFFATAGPGWLFRQGSAGGGQYTGEGKSQDAGLPHANLPHNHLHIKSCQQNHWLESMNKREVLSLPLLPGSDVRGEQQ